MSIDVDHNADWTRLTLRWIVAGQRSGVLEWSITEDSASASFVTERGSEEIGSISRVSVVNDGPLVHIDAGSSLSASIRFEPDGSANVLYARTSKLGVPGGRARVDGCEVERTVPQTEVMRRRISSF